MIREVSFDGFRGQTKEYDLDKLNLVCGPNGAGKSTIGQAVELTLRGNIAGMNIDKKTDAIFKALCGEGKKEMAIKLIADEGTIETNFEKVKLKNSTTIRRQQSVNGEDIKASMTPAEQIGFDLFNLTRFWAAPVQERVKILCDRVGIDPDTIEEIEHRLKQANDQKKKADHLLEEKRKALNEWQKKLQDMEVSIDGINLEERDARMQKLRESYNKINDEVIALERKNSEAERNSIELESCKQKIYEISSRSSEEMTKISKQEVEELEEKLQESTKLKDKAQLKRQYSERLESIKMTPPTPPAKKRHEMDAWKDELKALLSEGSAYSADPADIMARDMMRAIRADVEADDSLDAEIKKVFFAVIFKHVTPVLERIKKAEESGAKDQRIMQLKDEILNWENLIDNYEQAYAQHTASVEETKMLRNQIDALGEFEFDEDDHIELERALNDGKAKLAKIERHEIAMKASHEEQERLSERMAELAELPLEKTDASELRAQSQDKLNELRELEAKVKETAIYENQIKLNKQISDEVRALAEKAAMLKEAEKEIQDERIALLESLQEKIQDRVNTIIAPASVEVVIEGGSKGRLDFFINLPGGRRVLREVASGAEQVEFDIGMSSAMLKDKGMVIAEVSELDDEHLQSLIRKLQLMPEGLQYLLIGHRGCSAEGLTVIEIGA